MKIQYARSRFRESYFIRCNPPVAHLSISSCLQKTDLGICSDLGSPETARRKSVRIAVRRDLDLGMVICLCRGLQNSGFFLGRAEVQIVAYERSLNCQFESDSFSTRATGIEDLPASTHDLVIRAVMLVMNDVVNAGIGNLPSGTEFLANCGHKNSGAFR